MCLKQWTCIAIILLAGTTNVLADTYTVGNFLHDVIKPGQRLGLAGRFDIAGGLVHTAAEHSSWTPTEWTSDDGGGGVVFGVGVGVSDQIMINASIRGLVYGEYAPLAVVTGPFALLFADEHIAAVFSLSYYLRRDTPSWFLELGIGGASMGNPFDDSILYKESENGPTFFGGLGYEFAKHYQVEINLLWTQNEDDDHARRGKWTATSVFLTIGVLGY